MTRVLRLTVIGILVEGALFAVGRWQPAMAGVFRSLSWVVAAVFLVMILRALRRRKGGDRRHADRRHPSPGGSESQ